eukprot:516378-Amphidinium_carterae.4
MKAHQSDRDAEEGRVDRSDLHGNCQADVAANRGTREHLPLEPSDDWKQWSTVCQAVRNFWLLMGPKLRSRAEQWPRVRLPAPEPVPEVVESERFARFPAEPFVCRPHLHVVEHETYAICLDCQRHVGVHTGKGRLNYHVLRGKPCKLCTERRKLVPGFASHVDEVETPVSVSTPLVSAGSAVLRLAPRPELDKICRSSW